MATVAVAGPGAMELVSRHFFPVAGKPLAEFPANRIVFGQFQSLHGATEEIVVANRNEAGIELHCHGGPAAVAALVDTLRASGCQQISWQVYGTSLEADVVSTEARSALAETHTERTAAILLDQYRGALHAATAEICSLLAGDRPSAEAKINRLIELAPLGEHLTKPWRVVLAGRPNVGKSSLINALLGYQRSIVFDQPGTTRDILTACTAIAGWPVELADTAGLRETTDTLEQQGVERARQQIAAADLVLLILDATTPWSATDDWLWRQIPPAVARCIVWNKIDMVTGDFATGRQFPGSIGVSAITSAGLEDLQHTIESQLVPAPPQAGEAVLFTARQRRLLEWAKETLARDDPEATSAILNSLITGE